MHNSMCFLSQMTPSAAGSFPWGQQMARWVRSAVRREEDSSLKIITHLLSETQLFDGGLENIDRTRFRLELKAVHVYFGAKRCRWNLISCLWSPDFLFVFVVCNITQQVQKLLNFKKYLSCTNPVFAVYFMRLVAALLIVLQLLGWSAIVDEGKGGKV